MLSSAFPEVYHSRSHRAHSLGGDNVADANYKYSVNIISWPKGRLYSEGSGSPLWNGHHKVNTMQHSRIQLVKHLESYLPAAYDVLNRWGSFVWELHRKEGVVGNCVVRSSLYVVNVFWNWVLEFQKG